MSIDTLLAEEATPEAGTGNDDRDVISVAVVGTNTRPADAPAVAAEALETMSRVRSFSVADNAANVNAYRSGLYTIAS